MGTNCEISYNPCLKSYNNGQISGIKWSGPANGTPVHPASNAPFHWTCQDILKSVLFITSVNLKFVSCI